MQKLLVVNKDSKMYDNEKLIEKLQKVIRISESEVEYYELPNVNMSLTQIRDKIIGSGTILEEDFQNQIYVMAIMSGMGDMNEAIVVIQLYEQTLKIMAYAREGLIKQNTAKKAINKLLKILCVNK